MAKFVKKPVVIEAFQWTGDETQTEDPEWIIKLIQEGRIRFETRDRKICMLIDTLEGTMVANRRDFIIKGIMNEIYPCRPDIFLMTYEPLLEITSAPLTEEELKELEKLEND